MKAKVGSMLLVVAMVLSLSISASAAAGGDISPMYDSAGRCSPSLIFSGKTATCIVKVDANESTAKITATMTLYKIESNGILTRITSWSNLTGTGSLNISKPYSVPSTGYNYRLSVSGTIKDSTGTHSISAYRDAYCSQASTPA